MSESIRMCFVISNGRNETTKNEVRKWSNNFIVKRREQTVVIERRKREREKREDERRGGRDEANEIDAFIRRADPWQCCRRLVTILSKQSCRRLIFNFLTAEPSSPLFVPPREQFRLRLDRAQTEREKERERERWNCMESKGEPLVVANVNDWTWQYLQTATPVVVSLASVHGQRERERERVNSRIVSARSRGRGRYETTSSRRTSSNTADNAGNEQNGRKEWTSRGEFPGSRETFPSFPRSFLRLDTWDKLRLRLDEYRW